MNTALTLPHALELRCPPIPTVRIGMVGLGRRGMNTLERYACIDGAEIIMLADLDPGRLRAANAALEASGRPAARIAEGPGGWMEICESPEVDLLYVCTDWSTHCVMAVEAMKRGKHVAVEVPAATTVEECWRLVETAERTRRHLFMTENCCYDLFSLATYRLKEEGSLGEVFHCEGAYIHNLRPGAGTGSDRTEQPAEARAARRDGQAARAWMARNCAAHDGNPYPTHGMGPIGWLLGLHRGDRMDYLVSLTAASSGQDRLRGKVNSTLIRTVGGASILLQLDVTTPRPYNRLQTVCGSKGFAQKYPVPALQFGDKDPLVGEAAWQEAEKATDNDAARLWRHGHALGVPNEMNYAMDARLIHCLRHGLPLDIDVYDAAEWSCIAELSQMSARQGSRPVTVPDFTRGRWRELKRHTFH